MRGLKNEINKPTYDMKKLYNFLKIKLCYKTYWKQWIAFLTLLILFILQSEYADYTTKRVLEYDREKAIERLELAKEKDSIENKKG
jgi:hypothetical protein